MSEQTNSPNVEEVLVLNHQDLRQLPYRYTPHLKFSKDDRDDAPLFPSASTPLHKKSEQYRKDGKEDAVDAHVFDAIANVHVVIKRFDLLAL